MEQQLRPATSYTSISLHEPVLLRRSEHEAIGVKTVPDLFRESCQKFAQLPALFWERKETQDWKTLTYAEYEEQVERAARMLIHFGLEARSSLGVLAFNCPEWFVAEFGALRAGGIVSGIYPSNSAEACFHALETSEATVCVVDDDKQMAKLREIKHRLPRLKSVIQLHGPYESFVNQESGYYSWEHVMSVEMEQLQPELLSREREVCANDCAMLIFTSGTVGMPKAVMLSHDSIVFEAKIVAATLKNAVPGGERVVSYLPLSHIAAQIFDVFLPLEHGGCVYFADKDALKGTLVRSFLKARPTRMFGVPRVFEKFQEKLVAAEAKAKPYSRLLLAKAREVVAQHQLAKIAGGSISWYLQVKYWFASRIIRSIRQMLGLDQCKTFLTGAAPVSAELKQYFLGLDMPLADVYGMSEAGGAVTLHENITNLYSSGFPLVGIEVKINEPDVNGHGEIMTRGRNSFMGYLGQPIKTEETIEPDGWLHSGDLGYLDQHGNVVISGRIKELIITAGGENIPPVHIEQLIMQQLPCVSTAILIGDHRKYLTVLLTLKTNSDPNTGLPLDELREETVAWLEELGLKHTRLSELYGIPADLQLTNEEQVLKAALEINAEPKILEAIEAGIRRANQDSISSAQRVQEFALLPHEFSVPTGELGPTLKIRRNIVHKKYASVIDRLYK